MKRVNFILVILILVIGSFLFLNRSQGSSRTFNFTTTPEIVDLFNIDDDFIDNIELKNPEPVKFAVIGDYGDPTGPADQVADLIHSWNVHALVTTGDNAYPNGSYDQLVKANKRYQNFVSEYRLFPTLGNHDWWAGYPNNLEVIYSIDNLPSSEYFSYLPGNKRYYSTLLGNGLVKIIVLSTDTREPDLYRQAEFLQNELRSDEPYKFVFTHSPPFSSCEGKSFQGSNFPYDQWNLYPSAVFSGHCHLYEHLVDPSGVHYIVQGAGGGGQADQINSQPTGASSVAHTSQKGAVLVEVNATQAVITFVTTDGTVIEQFSVLPSK